MRLERLSGCWLILLCSCSITEKYRSEKLAGRGSALILPLSRVVTEVQVNVAGIHFDRKEENNWPRERGGPALAEDHDRQSNLT